MSRYLLLFLLNLPIVIIGALEIVTKYKLKKIGKRRFMIQLVFWLTVIISLAMTYPIYSFLYSNSLTDTEPLSLFDVVQITAIVFLLYSINKLHTRLELSDRRLQDLHQELSIILSSKK